MQENLSFPLRTALKWETQGGFMTLGTKEMAQERK